MQNLIIFYRQQVRRLGCCLAVLWVFYILARVSTQKAEKAGDLDVKKEKGLYFGLDNNS